MYVVQYIFLLILLVLLILTILLILLLFLILLILMRYAGGQKRFFKVRTNSMSTFGANKIIMYKQI